MHKNCQHNQIQSVLGSKSIVIVFLGVKIKNSCESFLILFTSSNHFYSSLFFLQGTSTIFRKGGFFQLSAEIYFSDFPEKVFKMLGGLENCRSEINFSGSIT